MRNKNKFNEKQKAQIRHWKKKMKDVVLYKKIEVLDYAAKGYTNKEISKLTGYTIRRISSLMTEYIQNGIDYFLTEHRKGGNSRRNLTDAQEYFILEKFKYKAEKGQIVSLRDVKKEYESIHGKEVASSTFYDFLRRMGWRRIMPRGAHPKKASEEIIEDFKKELTCN
jgi:transposase